MGEITYIEAIRQALAEEMARDDKVFLLGEDIGLHGGVFTSTKGLLDRFGPKRVRQTPISEAAIVGAAAGASLLGLRPVAEIMYFNFITIAMDQIVNHIAKLRYMSAGQVKLPLVIRTQGGAGRGKGPTHSDSLESWFFHVPGLKVVMPSNAYDAKGLLKASIRDDNPVLFLENAILYNTKCQVPEEEYVIPLGKAEIKRAGNEITIVATSAMVKRSLEAAEELEKEGISSEVIDLRTLVPLDIDAVIGSVTKTGRLLIVHEAVKQGGIGAEIAALVNEKAFDYLDAPIQRIGGLGVPVPFAQPLEEKVVPNTASILEAGKNLINL
jgi:pyruvate dehydrogenase E1 component beta subunit